MIGDTNAAVGTLCPVSSCITDQIATDENIWLWECVPACLRSTLVQLLISGQCLTWVCHTPPADNAAACSVWKLLKFPYQGKTSRRLSWCLLSRRNTYCTVWSTFLDLIDLKSEFQLGAYCPWSLIKGLIDMSWDLYFLKKNSLVTQNYIYLFLPNF